MKKIWVLLIASVLFISFSGISFAQGGKAPAKAEQAKAAELSGKILSIDTAKNTITVEEKKGVEKTINVNATQISSLKADDHVRITLKADGTTAENITVVTKKKTK
jgi:hypothetical protein